ncbi:hypothetical protein FN846DRAFT_204952 [Sphaerosporella brunnea]|uniref:NAD(P)-binding domain-containing protein n=1 Tax=Sphaerosporella brunnea TaxID=1250544 RepID=A0A5J5F8B8_9PEZI|nr:hypothetical protein FN846DRAFT_204952 [Sphaerosporella brunnea]
MYGHSVPHITWLSWLHCRPPNTPLFTHSKSPMAPKKILLLGATGPSGIEVIKYAIAHDVEVLVYARNPDKIPEALRSDIHVTILPGGELSDTAALRDAVAQKPDAVVSLLGPPLREILSWMNPFSSATKQPVFVNAYRVVVDAMTEFGVKRILAMGTISIPDEKDKLSIGRNILVWLVRLFMYNGWKNIVSVGKFFDGLEQEDRIQWTVFRLGAVLDGGFQNVTDGYVADGKTALSVRRVELAQWLVEQAVKEDPEWVGEKPVVSSAKKQKI